MKKEKVKWSEMTKKKKVLHIIDCIMKSIILCIVGICVVYAIVYNARGREKIARASVVGGDIGISTPTNSNNVFEQFGKKYAINDYQQKNRIREVVISLGNDLGLDSTRISAVKDTEKDIPSIKYYNKTAKSWDEVYYFTCRYGILTEMNFNVYLLDIWAYHEERGVYDAECGFVFIPEFSDGFPPYEDNLVVTMYSEGDFSLAFNYKEPIFDYENKSTGEILENITISNNPDFLLCRALMRLQNSSLTSDKIYSSGYEEGYIKGTDEGYTMGEQSGYQNGYNVGYEAGKSQATTFNPVGMMIEPVAKLLDVKLFGNFSIGNFFTAALFVTLAISFMKMFAGG